MAKGLPEEVEALGAVLAAISNLKKEQQTWVLSSVVSNLGLQQIAVGTTSQTANNAGNTTNTAPQNLSSMTPKQFLHSKGPKSDVQRIVCLAYYLTHVRSQTHFKTNDLTLLNVEAAAPRLSNPSVAVNNATKQSNYLAPAGGGNKQITQLGEDVVMALPDQEKVKNVEQQKRLTKRKSVKKKAEAKPKV